MFNHLNSYPEGNVLVLWQPLFWKLTMVKRENTAKFKLNIGYWKTFEKYPLFLRFPSLFGTLWSSVLTLPLPLWGSANAKSDKVKKTQRRRESLVNMFLPLCWPEWKWRTDSRRAFWAIGEQPTKISIHLWEKSMYGRFWKETLPLLENSACCLLECLSFGPLNIWMKCLVDELFWGLWTFFSVSQCLVIELICISIGSTSWTYDSVTTQICMIHRTQCRRTGMPTWFTVCVSHA